MKEDNIIRATVFVHKVDDRYPGETEDILKKIAEAGEEPTQTRKPDTLPSDNPAIREGWFRYMCKNYLSGVIPTSGVEKLIEMGFCEAPASTKYHGSRPGGLVLHSMEVCSALIQLTVDCRLDWERPESPIIIGYFHDLCKIDQYIRQEDGTYTWNKEVPQEHGEKSIDYIEKYAGIKLTEEEKACIRYHMGAFIKEDIDGYCDAIKKFPNVLFTHTADMVAARIKGI